MVEHTVWLDQQVRQPAPAEACTDVSPPIRTSSHEPGYWEEKSAEERDMYRQEQAQELERAYPERGPR
jgi:hypothetical protein